MSKPTSREAFQVQPQKEWTQSEVDGLQQYITRNPQFLVYLASRCPKIEGKTVEEIALSGARHQGFEDLFAILVTMTSEPIASDSSQFLTDEQP